MTNEQRIEKLEKLVEILYQQKVPTLDRQNPATGSRGPYREYSYVTSDGGGGITSGYASAFDFISPTPHGIYRDLSDGGKIKAVRRAEDEVIFQIGDEVLINGLKYTIDLFTQTSITVFASCTSERHCITISISDLIPLAISGGSSADWMGKHGVREWDIVSFRSVGKWDNQHSYICTLNSNGTYSKDEFTLDSMLNGYGSLKDGRFEIYEVKRLSDGTTWKLGDETNRGVIQKFSINGDCMGIDTTDWFNTTLAKLRIVPLKPEWKVLEFKEKDGAGLVDAAKVGSWNISQYDIWKVKRLSDDTIWKVGDKITIPFYGNRDIKGFEISHQDMMIKHAEGAPFNIKYAIKQKPLFITVDGISAYEGDTIFWTRGTVNRWVNEAPVTKRTATSEYQYGYSTREAAEKANGNFRKLSFISADGVGIYMGDTVYNIGCSGQVVAREWAPFWEGMKMDLDIFYSSETTLIAAREELYLSKEILSIKDIIDKIGISEIQVERLRHLVKEKLMKK